MRLSTRSTYGMRALVELALAVGRGQVPASRIATRQNLSIAYLEQLLHRLKKHGLITSVRGPKGGYLLAKDPRRITMAEVVRILEGGHGTANGSGRLNHRSSHRAATSLRQAEHIAQVVWSRVHERLVQSLDTVTLQDLCEEVRARGVEPLDHRYVFHI